jgi:hypothetical protein
MFNSSDEAINLLDDRGYGLDRRLISINKARSLITEDESEAINYLVNEWDFSVNDVVNTVINEEELNRPGYTYDDFLKQKWIPFTRRAHMQGFAIGFVVAIFIAGALSLAWFTSDPHAHTPEIRYLIPTNEAEAWDLGFVSGVHAAKVEIEDSRDGFIHWSYTNNPYRSITNR